MTDWDDGDSSGFQSKSSSGFGGGFGRGGLGRGGFGKSEGGGFGSSNGFGDSNGVGSKGRGFGGGFGSSNGGGGFGSSSATNGDDWGEGGSSGGFGSSSGGFGSKSGGFGSSSGFGRSEDSEAPRGGGFSSRSGGFGGDRREGGSSGGGGCYKCGEDGHFARECPNSDSSGGNRGGGRSRACFKCGQEGHMSRECPNSDSSSGGGGFGGGGGGGRSRACYKCGEEGHMSRECPNSESSGGRGGGGGGGGGDCYKCGEAGHFARECPKAESSGDRGGGFGSRSGGGGGGGSGACFKCNEEGHMARDCPNAAEEEKKREPNYIPPAPPEDEEAIFLSMQRGINFDKYDEIPVECTGDDAPQRGISTFEEADLSPLFRENVRKAHYERPTPVQKWAIPIIRKGRDLMACAQTGSGKTAAFLLPVLTGMVEKGCGGGSMQETQTPMAIIIGPTRELVLQIYNEARKFAHGSMIRPVVVYGGTSVQHQLSMLQRGANMVIGTPGRLSDFITRGRISLSEVRYMILDEADRMLDMGFGPEVRKIVDENGMPAKEERQTLMFSATFPEEIQRLAKDFLKDYLFVTVGRVGSANTDIKQTVHSVSQYDKREKLVEILNESGQDRVLVFVETKRQADFIASYLSQSQFPTTSIHGDRLQREREEALADFKSGKAPILVATSVAARGLDIPGVKHVINFDLPSSIDEYVHRIGRTGRCGNLGKASSFYDPDKNNELARSLVKVLEDATQEVPSFLESAAEQGTGTGFSGVGGKFGGRDTRRGNFGGSSGGGGSDDWGGDSSGFGGGGFSSTTNAEEESWD